VIEQRARLMSLVTDALKSGARQSKICAILGISARTLQRWVQPDNIKDRRQEPSHEPRNKSSELERQRVLSITNEAEYANLPPSKFVPKLADRGLYLASESTFYRILKANKLLTHRHSTKPVRTLKRPRALVASAPNEIYSWDITYLPTQVRGQFVYLYLVMDVYSRKIIGWQVYDAESRALAADLMRDIW